jgi:hypothetical protein
MIIYKLIKRKLYATSKQVFSDQNKKVGAKECGVLLGNSSGRRAKVLSPHQ